MTLAEIKDPEGRLPLLLTEQSALVPCLWGWGQVGGTVSPLAHLGGLKVSVPWSGKEGWGGVPLRERRPAGWDKKVQEGWFGPAGEDRKALTPAVASVFAQLRAALLG